MDTLTATLDSNIRTLSVEMFDGQVHECRHNLSDAHLKAAKTLARKYHAVVIPRVDGIRLVWESGKQCGVFRRSGWWFAGWYNHPTRNYTCVGYQGQLYAAPSEKVAVEEGFAAGFEALPPALKWAVTGVV